MKKLWRCLRLVFIEVYIVLTVYCSDVKYHRGYSKNNGWYAGWSGFHYGVFRQHTYKKWNIWAAPATRERRIFKKLLNLVSNSTWINLNFTCQKLNILGKLSTERSSAIRNMPRPYKYCRITRVLEFSKLLPKSI